MAAGGKRAGSRRGPRRRSSLRPSLFLLAGGVTLAVVAWGYLVYAAIDFGASARSGNRGAWWFLALASVGAVACLFVGLMLVARLLRRLGITGEGSSSTTPGPDPSRRDSSGRNSSGRDSSGRDSSGRETSLPSSRTSSSTPTRASAPAAFPDPPVPPTSRPVGGRRAAR